MKALIILLSIISSAVCYNILCLFPVPSKSHNHLGKGIVDALLKANHKVTWGTPFPPSASAPNLSIIDLSSIQSITAGINMVDPRMKQDPNMPFVFGRNISRMTYSDPKVREVLVKQNFDAVITEWFFSDTDCGFAAVQKAPWILLSGVVMHAHLESLIDDVRTLSTHPLIMNNFPIPMSFWQRMTNTFMFAMMKFGQTMSLSTTTEIYESNFAPLAAARGVTLPPYEDALHNISILLVNSHPSFAAARPMPPNAVDIAGYHISEEVAPLPKDLKDILDSSPNGVIYFSMGSVVKSSAFPEDVKAGLIKGLARIPYTVLWKFETEVTGLPKNVHVRPWFPQASVLAHPNVKLFITHGGMLSTLEALQYGVPLIADPIFGDQPANADRAVQLGYAKRVEFGANMGEDLKTAAVEMMKDTKYYNQAKYLSKLFRNRPVSPSKLIAHYVELAIESKGAYHLRSKAKLYTWYQRLMLDQLAFVFFVLAVIYLVLKRIARFALSGKGQKQKKN